MKPLQKLFYPESVAVAGASPRPDNMASFILRNLTSWGYKGKLYGVNPSQQGEAYGVKIYPSLADVPGEVDVLIALSPARSLPGLAEDCGKKGVPYMIVETAGFSEYDEAGAAIGDALREKAAAAGVRFTGPNCLGIINAENAFSGVFTWLEPFAPGCVSLLSQSGGVGLAVMMGLYEHNMTVNKFVSMGNKYDLDESDYLEFLIDDPGTEIILMFLESVQRGRKFVEVASRSRKPIIAYKAGVTDAGRRKAQSHTASLANDDRVVSAALEQAGVIRVDSLTDLMHYARMFTTPKMRGNRLAVISPAGGYTVISADECSRAGFVFPPLTPKTAAHVKNSRRAGVIKTENPLDLGDAFGSDTVFSAVNHTMRQGNIDAGLVLLQRRPSKYYSGVFSIMARNIIPDMETLAAELRKPIVTIILGQPEVVVENRADSKAPVYSSFETALRAMSAYRDFCTRERKPFNPPKPSIPRTAKEIIKSAFGPMILGQQAMGLLAELGIMSPSCVEAPSAAKALTAAKKLGFPVAMKIISSGMSHKSDVGGVRLNIEGSRQAAKAATDLARIIDSSGVPGGILVQKMAPPGLELIVGAKRDPVFGPVIVFGIGGILVEILKDVALRLAPVSHETALEMIHSISGAELLRGVRGGRAVNVKSVASAISAASRLIAASDGIAELDINPLIAYPDGCVAVDARIVLDK